MTLPNDQYDTGTGRQNEIDAVGPGGILLYGYLRKLKVKLFQSSPFSA